VVLGESRRSCHTPTCVTMLLYSNRSHIRLVFQLKGSVVFGDWRQIVMGLFLSAVSAGLHYLIESESRFAPRITHSYGLHTLGVLVSFAVVFRVNLAWGRYWEALTSVHCMYSKWGDAFMQFATFCSCDMETIKSKPNRDSGMEQTISKLKSALDDAQKFFSILSAMAANEIHHGDEQEMDARLNVSSWSEQIARRRETHVQEKVLSPSVPNLQEGTSSKQTFAKSCFDTSYVVRRYPTQAEVGALEASPDRVHLSMTWIIKTLTMVQTVLSTPPPIQSRMYQELSNGYVHFTNAKKISDVPFPFNYAQILAIILIVFSMMLPVYIAAFTKSYIAGPLLTFMVFHSMTCVNRLAEILENPFGHDMDDISLEDFHMRFLQVMEVTVAALDVSLHPEDYTTKSTSHRRFFREGGNDEIDGSEALPAHPDFPVVLIR